MSDGQCALPIHISDGQCALPIHISDGQCAPVFRLVKYNVLTYSHQRWAMYPALPLHMLLLLFNNVMLHTSGDSWRHGDSVQRQTKPTTLFAGNTI